MSENQILQDTIIQILSDYYATVNRQPANISYQFTSDMEASYKKLRPDLSDDIHDDQNNYNGLMLTPKDMAQPFTILINANKIKEYEEIAPFTWIGTLVHETTHVLDYIEYAKLIDAKDYDSLLRKEHHLMFQLWTEFNARSKGYYFVRKYSSGSQLQDESQIDGIINQELPSNERYLFKCYHSTNDGTMQMYYVAQFLGRIQVLQDLFPDFFDDEWVSEMPLFTYNSWMHDWYVFLHTHTELEDAFKHFDEMKEILSQNFTWLE